MIDPLQARGPTVLRAILAGIAVLALVVPAYIVTHAPVIRRPVRIVTLPKRIVPQAELPTVEPVEFVDLAPDDARAFNAEVPFSTAPNPAARPFRFAGSDDERARAIDCLAVAALYEAGDDAVGERAVAQVVLNRLRHPAFPKTVCGVVFEGSERSTGCQFSFTCDGALTRWKPSDLAWSRARDVAGHALSGGVFGPVGYATHYHTDWVVPYWQSSLDKVTAVHTHLFFRWTGWWGTPPAFNRQVDPAEPAIAQLAALSPAHRMGAALAQGDAAIVAAAPFLGRLPSPLASDPDTFLMQLDARQPADAYVAMAQAACGERAHCKVMGWTNAAAMASTVPITPEQIAAMSFSYLRDRPSGYDKPLWNCAEVKRSDPRQCMKRQLLRAVPAPAADAMIAPPMLPFSHGPDDLAGVRRKVAPAPAPASQAARNISGGNAISDPAPPSIDRRNAPATGITRSAK